MSASTYLGDNTVPILAYLADALGRHPGLAEAGCSVRFDPNLSDQDRLDGINQGGFDLVWVCGLYTVSRLVPADHYRVVAAPVFAGESDPVYRSVILAHPDSGFESLEDAVSARAGLVANETDSWSGYHGLLHELRRRRLPLPVTEADGPAGRSGGGTGHEGTGGLSTVVFSGSHAESVQAVADDTFRRSEPGSAQGSDGAGPRIAAIDHTVWDHLVVTDHPAARRLVVIDRTADWPAPPFSLRSDLDPSVAAALTEALLAPATVADTAHLHAIVPADADDYKAMLA